MSPLSGAPPLGLFHEGEGHNVVADFGMDQEMDESESESEDSVSDDELDDEEEIGEEDEDGIVDEGEDEEPENEMDVDEGFFMELLERFNQTLDGGEDGGALPPGYRRRTIQRIIPRDEPPSYPTRRRDPPSLLVTDRAIDSEIDRLFSPANAPTFSAPQVPTNKFRFGGSEPF